jgi:putative lipoprotein
MARMRLLASRPAVLSVLLSVMVFAPLPAWSAVGETPKPDPWLSSDKAAHFALSAGLAGAGYAGGAFLFERPQQARWLTGAGLALGVGVAKEFFDAGRGSIFSWKDLTWDVLGAATGLTLAWAVDRFFLPRGEVGRGVALGPAREHALREGGAGLPARMSFTLALSRGGRGHPQGGPGNGRTVPVVLFLMGGW